MVFIRWEQAISDMEMCLWTGDDNPLQYETQWNIVKVEGYNIIDLTRRLAKSLKSAREERDYYKNKCKECF